MANKNVAVSGIYKTAQSAEAAVDHLISTGFSNSAISVLLPDDECTRAFAHEKNTKAPEGTTTGAATGGVVGGTLGSHSHELKVLRVALVKICREQLGPAIAAGPRDHCYRRRSKAVLDSRKTRSRGFLIHGLASAHVEA